MILAIQLAIILFVFAFRGYRLLGWHLSSRGAGYLEHVSKSKNGTITERHIGAKQSGAIPFIIKRERWYHRWLKAMGIASEVHIGDAEFDDNYFFITDMPEHVEMALHSRALLGQLKKLYALGITELRSTPTRIWCVLSYANSPPDVLNRYYEVLRSISQIISNKQLDDTAGRGRSLQLLAFGCICIHAALLTYAMIGFFAPATDTYDTFDWERLELKALLIGLGIIGLWVAAILTLFKESSWVCWVLTDLLVCGVVGILLTSSHLAREGNIDLVQGPPVIKYQNVISKSCTLHCYQRCGRRCSRTSDYPFAESACSPEKRNSNRNLYIQRDSVCRSSANFRYHLSVSHWNRGQPYSFDTGQVLFDKTFSGDALAVPVHPGAFGAEWVDSQTISKP